MQMITPQKKGGKKYITPIRKFWGRRYYECMRQDLVRDKIKRIQINKNKAVD